MDEITLRQDPNSTHPFDASNGLFVAQSGSMLMINQQQAFIDAGATGNSVFLAVSKLTGSRRGLETAHEPLVSHGASAQTTEV